MVSGSRRACLLAAARQCRPRDQVWPYSTKSDETKSAAALSNSPCQPPSKGKDPGAMTRRLQEATEEALFSGRSGRRAIEEAGFDPGLKAALLAKISEATFASENPVATSSTSMPRATGEGARQVTMGKVWTGGEETADAVLRMLDDAKKPLPLGMRRKATIPTPSPVDLRPATKPKTGPGSRVENARAMASIYVNMGLKNETPGKGPSDPEKEAMRREFKERFTPGATAMPATISGLAQMANKRIEDAIARGQFKNIPRGKGVERDVRADNPFIDTTQYIMNKMIQRQDLVPPWIEKQQEVFREANIFRSRLRESWKRHAARMISSRGGTLEAQVARAEEYAKAEVAHNPRRRDVEQISLSANSLSNATDSHSSCTGSEGTATSDEGGVSTMRLFRDPAWEATERSYMELAISKLNSLTRSYNLMAPDLAKKPYFSLQRELDSCYADVAPDVGRTIRDRSSRPNKSFSSPSPTVRPAFKLGIMSSSGSGSAGKADRSKYAEVQDEKGVKYGFRQFFRDLWKPPTRE